MAGGDGSQAIVATIAAELDLPYACIPSGTRNHFALDLGVDRDDVVGALDAFVDGGERRVDLGVVNGRVFVNNVSLGVYAEAVQRSGYRDAKIRTLLDTVPDAIGPEGSGLDLRWTGPGGDDHRGGAVIMVSNNQYRLGRTIGSGTRPAIDDGLLGIMVAGAPTGRGERGRSAAAAVARVDRADVRGRRRRPRSRRDRRRGRAPRAAPAIQHPHEGAAGAHRAPASGRIAVGAAPRGHRRQRAHPCADSCRARSGVKRNTNEGDLMDIVEIEQKEKVSREEVVSRLRKLATSSPRATTSSSSRAGCR